MTTNQLGPSATTAASVANEFLSLATQEGVTIDQMKLQKLIFYAHAWHLGMKNAPLIEEDFEAWPWGPVVRDIYTQTTRFKKNPITENLTELDSQTFEFHAPNGVESQELKDFIKNVWDVHKPFTGIQLSNSTHADGEPWTIIKNQYGSLDGKPHIPDALIATIYKRKTESANTAS